MQGLFRCHTPESMLIMPRSTTFLRKMPSSLEVTVSGKTLFFYKGGRGLAVAKKYYALTEGPVHGF